MLGFVARDAEEIALGHLGPEFREAVAVNHARDFEEFCGRVAVVEVEALGVGLVAAADTGLLGLPGIEDLEAGGWGLAILTLGCPGIACGTVPFARGSTHNMPTGFFSRQRIAKGIPGSAEGWRYQMVP
jgi:hypothetical protein